MDTVIVNGTEVEKDRDWYHTMYRVQTLSENALMTRVYKCGHKKIVMLINCLEYENAYPEVLKTARKRKRDLESGKVEWIP